jgi:iron complex outermembrane receptor protein
VTNAGFQVRWEESRRQADRGLSWFVNRTATTWVFVEHERPLAAGLLLRGGISGHLFMYDSWDRSSESVNPSLNLEWKLRNYTITGSVSRVTRFPTLNQLFSTSSGNPDLNPEWAYKGEVTVSRNVSGIVTISAAGFLNRLHDMIYRSGKLDIYHNIEKARLDGVEMNGELRVSSLTLFSGVTLLDARSGNGEKLEYQPSLKVDSRLVWSIIPDLQLNMVSRVVGRRKTEVHTFLPSYHVENTGIVIGENRFLSASLIINNIFDVNYEEEFGYPMAGRTVLAGIDWHGGKR